MPPAALVIAVGLALALGGCGGGQDAPVPLEPTLSSLEANVFGPRCTGPCHSGGADVAAGGLDMEPGARASMLDVLAASSKCEDSGMTLLVAGQPDDSLAYLKIVAKADGTDPPCGDPMPQGRARPTLTSEEIAAIRDWIAAGAPAD